jgi:hypothetical protein
MEETLEYYDGAGETGAPVQREAATGSPAVDQGALLAPAVQERAAEGVSGRGGPLPHREAIQVAFGRHDVGNIEAHVGGPAAGAAADIGAEAYATGTHVAFAGSPDLHTAAHEAAHVVQQRGGVQLKMVLAKAATRTSSMPTRWRIESFGVRAPRCCSTKLQAIVRAPLAERRRPQFRRRRTRPFMTTPAGSGSWRIPAIHRTRTTR